MKYDLIIIGGGPAGAAAAVYAARKQLHTLIIADEFGGQSIESADIQNWIGTPSMTGEELAERLETHVQQYAGDILDIEKGVRATDVQENAKEDDKGFIIKTNDENSYETATVLVTTGSHRRKLDVPGADEFENKGLTYCATCDGPMFSGKDVAVIGGGNAGFESAAQLLAYAKSVTLLHYKDEFKAEPTTVEQVLSHENMTALKNANTTKITGDGFVTGLTYENTETGEEHELDVEGIFVEIGAIPTTDFVEDLVDTDQHCYIEIDPWTQQTSHDGIWAAGDCTNGLYHQNNIAAGDAVKALEDIYLWLKTR